MKKSEIFMDALNHVDNALLEQSEKQNHKVSIPILLGLLTTALLAFYFIKPMTSYQNKSDAYEAASEEALPEESSAMASGLENVEVDYDIHSLFLDNETITITIEIKTLDGTTIPKDTYETEIAWMNEKGYHFIEEENQYHSTMNAETFNQFIHDLQTRYYYYIIHTK